MSLSVLISLRFLALTLHYSHSLIAVDSDTDYWLHPDAELTMVRPVYVFKRKRTRKLSPEDQQLFAAGKAGYVDHF